MSARDQAPRPVLLAASPGGHLDLLERLRPALAGLDVVWVTADGSRANALRRHGERVQLLPLYGRHPLLLLKNFARAAALLSGTRPRLVVTSGAGLVAPLCLLARVFGIRVVFSETMARVTGPSLSGRVLSRLASVVLVQWPEMTSVYPNAVLCRPALLEEVPSGCGLVGDGTFVAVGTHSEPFDRLLATVDRAVEAGLLPGPVVAQSGVSAYRPRTYTPTPWLSPEQVETAAASARHVVCHAGSGIVATALRAGRKPLVMPRLRRHGEHVDDHQTQLADKLGALGLAVPVNGEIGEAELSAARAPLPAPVPEELSPTMASVLTAEAGAMAR